MIRVDWIAFYAAVVATVALTWQVVARIRDRRPRLTISLDVLFQTMDFEHAVEYGQLQLAGKKTPWPDTTIFEVRVVNVGREALTVTQLDIEVDDATGSGHSFSSDSDLPRRLERGELFGFAIEVSPQAFRPDTFVDASAHVSTGETFRAGRRPIHHGALIAIPAEPFEEMLTSRDMWRPLRVYHAYDVSDAEEE